MRTEIKKWAKLTCLIMVAVMALGACSKADEMHKEFSTKANNGDAESQYQLGRMYFEANGVDQSDKTGEFWVRKAAEQGHAQAQSDMGELYATGQLLVIRKNVVEADKWFILSSRQGHGAGTRNMKELEKTMLPAQIEQANVLANEWKPKKSK